MLPQKSIYRSRCWYFLFSHFGQIACFWCIICPLTIKDPFDQKTRTANITSLVAVPCCWIWKRSKDLSGIIENVKLWRPFFSSVRQILWIFDSVINGTAQFLKTFFYKNLISMKWMREGTEVYKYLLQKFEQEFWIQSHFVSSLSKPITHCKLEICSFQTKQVS